MSHRTCGRCHACCVHIKVEALQKPMGERCPHLQNGSGCCSIYADRPQECAVYTCAWLDGYFGKSLRPDKSGILLEESWIEEPRRLTILGSFEIRPDAIAAAQQRIASSLPESTVVFIVPCDGSDPVVIGRAEDQELFMAFLANCQRQGGIRHRMADGMFFQSLDGDGRNLVQLQTTLDETGSGAGT